MLWRSGAPTRVCVCVCSVLRDSAHLRCFLELVLALGNVLNGGTSKGCAYGFKLAQLGALADTKATAPDAQKLTLLHYLVTVAERHKPDALKGFLEEAKTLKQVCSFGVCSARDACAAAGMQQTRISLRSLFGSKRFGWLCMHALRCVRLNPFLCVLRPTFRQASQLDFNSLESDVKKVQAHIKKIEADVAAKTGVAGAGTGGGAGGAPSPRASSYVQT